MQKIATLTAETLPPAHVGPIGRLGRYAATHFRVVLVAWAVVALGARASSRRGWRRRSPARAGRRRLAVGPGPPAHRPRLPGLGGYGLLMAVHSPTRSSATPPSSASWPRRAHAGRRPAVRRVAPPAAGASISRDGHTAIVPARAARGLQRDGRRRGSPEGRVAALSAGDVRVNLTGAAGMWSDFNEANRERDAQVGAHVVAGDPRHHAPRLRLAGRRGAAADADDRRPRRLGRLPLLATRISPISIWAMNFALMFALALGIDYALFVVHALPRRASSARAVRRGRDGGDDGHRRQGGALLGADGAGLARGGAAGAEPGLPLDGRSGSSSRSSSSWPRR